MASFKPRCFLRLTLLFRWDTRPACAPRFSTSSDLSWLSVPGNPLVKWPSMPCDLRSPPRTNLAQIPAPESGQQPSTNLSQNEFSSIADILSDTAVSSGPALENALDGTGIVPSSDLLQAVFDQFDSSPKLLRSLFLWAEKKPGFRPSPALFSSMINVLAKSREFDSAWSLILHRLSADEEPALVTVDVFSALIRRYARAGMSQPAIRTFEFASSLNSISGSNSEILFEILLDSFCKEGQVRVASVYFRRKLELDPSWDPSIRVYNMLLNGWFRSRKLKHAERLWAEIKTTNLRPTVVTYGILVEGYSRMRRPERAIELVDEMRREGIQPNAIIYNPIIDALAEAQRFKEALGMLEQLLVMEHGATVATYNSLVKGFCKAGNLQEASKILRMMISRGFLPSPTTYNYFFRYFTRLGKIEEGMNLYTKMIESGYDPDRLTYHLLLKMLCEDGRLDLAIQVSKEMRARGYDMDLATSTMLIHLLCKMQKLEEAFAEFENMIRRGIVPQYLTFERMYGELNKQGMRNLAGRLHELMSSVPHSKKLPDTYGGNEDLSRARRTSIIRKAEAMSEIIKDCRNPRKLVKRRSTSESAEYIANRLIDDIKGRL